MCFHLSWLVLSSFVSITKLGIIPVLQPSRFSFPPTHIFIVRISVSHEYTHPQDLLINGHYHRS